MDLWRKQKFKSVTLQRQIFISVMRAYTSRNNLAITVNMAYKICTYVKWPQATPKEWLKKSLKM